MTIKLIIGLRNPGSQYEQTRHNAGAWFIKELMEKYTVQSKIEKKFHSEYTTLSIPPFLCKTLLPLTWMNQSGLPVQEIVRFYRIEAEEILVAHDDLDLTCGDIRLKTGGGHGGHNGLRDIISKLGTPDFHRLRIGIGHPGHKDQVVNYVLSKPSIEDKDLILTAINRSIDIMPLIVGNDLSKAMTLLH